jgi:sugar phosphate isomerase/epimerase
MSFKYSVFTVMTPEWTLEEAANRISECGYEGVEWRVTHVAKESEEPGYWRGNRCTVDIERLEEEAPGVKSLCESLNLNVSALGSYVGSFDTETIRQCMEFAGEVGCPQIRVSVPSYDGAKPYGELFDEALRNWEKVVKLSETTGVRANVETHMGNICPSASLAHRFVSNFDPKHVGVIYDPGNMVAEGFENWRLGLELLGPYLAHVHAKNMEWRYGTERTGTVRFNSHFTAIQEGIADWLQVLRALKSVGYEGWISMEDFSEMPTRRKLKDNLAYLKQLENELD